MNIHAPLSFRKQLSVESLEDFPKESLIDFEDLGPLPIKKFSRPVLKVRIQVKDTVICFMVVHLKSKRPIVSSQDRHDQKKQAVGSAKRSINLSISSLHLSFS